MNSDSGNVLDDMFMSRIRIAIVSLLMGAGSGEFTWLRQETGASDGNLGLHLRKLEDAGYITVEKSFVDRKPHTSYAMSARGRQAFLAYVAYLGRVVAADSENKTH